MNILPDELLIHVFAYLPPDNLSKLSVVSKRWNHIINDDHCWRTAYLCMWTKMPYRRLASTWRLEYSLRTNLLKSWETGRFNALTFEPRIGLVDKLYVDFQRNKLLTGSLSGEYVAICDTETGKASKDVINCNTDSSLQITCLKISPNRIYVGFNNGLIEAISNYKEGGSFAERTQFNIKHPFAVTCLESIISRNGQDAILVSGSANSIMIWSLSDNIPLVSLEFQGECKSFAVDVQKQLLLVLTAKELILWTDVNFSTRPTPIPQNETRRRNVLLNRLVSLNQFLYDAPSQTVFVPCANDIFVFCLYEMRVVSKLSHHASNICSLTWDNDVIDIPGQEQKQRRLCIIASGDETGVICLWDCRKLLESRLQNDQENLGGTVKPFRIFSDHLTKVSFLNIDSFKLVSVSQDAQIKVWDLLTGRCLREVNGNRKKRIVGDDVRCMVTSFQHIVIGSGSQISIWDFNADNELEPFQRYSIYGKGKESLFAKKMARKHQKQSIIANRIQRKSDAKQDVKDSNKMLELERQEREARDKLYEKMQIQNLTEQEMIDYAVMLSLETRRNQAPTLGQQEAKLKVDLGDVSDFPPLNTPPRKINEQQTSSAPKPIPIQQRSRKISLSDFIKSNSSFESALPADPLITSSSYQNVWQGFIVDDNPPSNAEEDEDNFEEDSTDFDEYVFPELGSSKRPSEIANRRTSGNVQIRPHPQHSRAREEEDQELKYVLELSLFEK